MVFFFIKVGVFFLGDELFGNFKGMWVFDGFRVDYLINNVEVLIF